MTTPAVLPHVQAVEDVLTAAGLTVYQGGAPPGPAAPPATYVVLYPSPGTLESASLADDRTVLDTTVQLTCVGSTPQGAVGTADRAAAALSPPLTVAGRACWRPERLGGPPLQRDDDLAPPLWYLPVQYRLRSLPD
ncbi:hypothetical protein [Kitasatospora sp. NPDC059571]|uniref:hypothetical protein n=1 Tax=Kitasatospora sp. NPDC059571 TaxID=3346871 RepID=UPI00369C47A2